MKLQKIFLFSAIVPVLFSGLFFWFFTQDLLGGKTSITGGFEDIDIYSTEMGLKLVDAKTFEGAIYGLGFIHARDRLWQMHMFRMLSQGRLSEVNIDSTFII
jgi:penicillin amidase